MRSSSQPHHNIVTICTLQMLIGSQNKYNYKIRVNSVGTSCVTFKLQLA